ncbi:unnamed protein product [Dracunculus medinensis]|uniref:Uncharacterized protein n=1 Tax=Dracunculus medinensis TaxID=318479 RepID=A0A0N4ULC7_DRAME|nr:unnamed protein product [Dracunculus medinensis]
MNEYEYFEKKEKELYLVGINILMMKSEKSNEEKTTTADRLLAKNIVAAAGTDYIKEVHRHGRMGSRRPQVLKIRLEDMAPSILRKECALDYSPWKLFAERSNENRIIARQTFVKRMLYAKSESEDVVRKSSNSGTQAALPMVYNEQFFDSNFLPSIYYSLGQLVK